MRLKFPVLSPEDAGKGGTADTAAADAAAKTAADAAAAKAAADTATADAAAKAKAEGDQVAKDAAAKAAADAAAAKAGEKKAPDKYELKVPEKSTLDESDVKAIETIARENGWTNEEAQSALQRHHDLLIEQSNQFLEVTKADKTYGGEHLAESQARAKAVIDLVRPASHPRAKAFRALLDKSGYGNHIEVVSFLADLGKLTAEDGVVGGGGKTGAAESVEEKLYGKAS